VIPDEPPWLRGSGYISSGGYQSLPSSSASVPPRQNSEIPIPTKPSKRIKPSQDARSKGDPLPEGCVDIFVAESESSEDESEGGSPGKTGWGKMKGRLTDRLK
jgi:hypothetical protein